MALDTTAIVSVADLKDAMGGMAGTNKDGVLESAINRASAIIHDYLGRKLCDSSLTTPFSRTEYHSLSIYTNELWLTDWPVVSVTGAGLGVYEDTSRAYATALVEDTDFVVDKPNGRLLRVFPGGGMAAWQTGFEAIKVVAVLGYKTPAGSPSAAGTVPSDIKDAVCWLAGRIFMEGERRQYDVMSTTDGTGTTTKFSASRLPPFIVERLESHRARRTYGRRAA